MVHGISKALVKFDEKFKTSLKTEKLTTRDSRAVERKNPGRRKARRRFQFSKRIFDICCASPFGRAVKIISTSFKYLE